MSAEEQLNLFDANGDGLLNESELRSGLRGEGVPENQIKQLGRDIMPTGAPISLRDESVELNSLKGKLDKLAQMKAELEQQRQANSAAQARSANAERELMQRRDKSIARSHKSIIDQELASLPAPENRADASAGKSSPSKAPVLDKRMVALLARLVDELASGFS